MSLKGIARPGEHEPAYEPGKEDHEFDPRLGNSFLNF